MMRSMFVVFFSVISIIGFTQCSTFEGIAGDPGETYTTTYNTPGQRVVPYNDQNVDANEPIQEIEVCEGLVKGGSMPRCDR